MYYFTVNPRTPPWEGDSPFSMVSCVTTPHTPWTHCRVAWCHANIPGRGSPSFLAAHSASCDSPSPSLHSPLLSRTPHILGTLAFIGVSNVPLVSLNLLPQVQKMMQYFVENFSISELTRGVWTLDPHQVTPQDTHAQLVAEGGFPCILVGCKCIPFCCRPLLGDTEVSPIDCNETVFEDAPLYLTVEEDLRLGRRGEPGGVNPNLPEKGYICNFCSLVGGWQPRRNM